MKRGVQQRRRRATVLLMIVGLLAMLFMLVTAFIMLARFDRQTLQMTGRADRVTHILDALNDVAAAALRGARGGDLVSGAAYVDIPGAGDPNDPNWGAPWLAAAEPVRNPLGGYDPIDYSYPAVSGFSGALDPNDANVPLTRLMLDDPTDSTSPGYVNLVPGDASNPASLNGDTRLNARQPFTDADGDGMPDSLFGSVGVLTELANAMGGRSVHATSVNTASLNPNDLHADQQANFLAWQQYDSTARYAVAAKIVSHGGMVQVSAPTDQVMWNSAFTGAMFNWIEHTLDVPIGGTLLPALNLADRTQLLAMYAQRGAVESVLRRRGGLLADSRGTVQDGLPPALWALQSRFPRTFASPYGQRFNLASLNDWVNWQGAATIDPTAYNAAPDPTTARAGYAARQVLTTVNNSDELARDQDPNLPDALGAPGIRAGQLKYYLGRVADAFDVNGHFVATAAGGFAVIRELADYFSEMLRGYEGWSDQDPSTESLMRVQQAYMLAVNTVAFAAPRDATGHVDAVYNDPADLTVYIGYAPQPFITQVVAYNSTETAGDPARIALAVELYNPHDAHVAGVSAVSHSLDLSQFAISLGEPADPAGTLLPLSSATGGPPIMDGRSFLVYAIHGAAPPVNDLFENWPNPADYANGVPAVLNLDVQYTSSTDEIWVNLWRSTTSLGWHLVDRLRIEPEGEPDQKWYRNVQRDCTWEAYLGTQGGKPERWRMVVAFDPGDSGYHDGLLQAGSPTSAEVHELGAAFDLSGNDPSSEATGAPPLGPSVPLHLMNAGLGPCLIHGVARPASFPTVGFMLFVPRFAHKIVSGAPPTYTTAGEALREQWQKRGYAFGTGLNNPPADFGHMPIFDNKQAPDSSGAGGFKKTGSVPWSLLVFDYFTTLNPDDPTVDPYRVPGRININDATWYVLAGLPLIGPTDLTATGDLPLNQATASPAFWSAASGVLAGQGAEIAAPTQRYPQWSYIDKTTAAAGQWYRLGPYLAQAAASYRDRVEYVAALSPFVSASYRNSGNLYRPNWYGTVRDTVGTVPCRGFLTIGELANVMGFDGSTDFSGLNGAMTVLGQYGGIDLGGDFMKAVSLLALLDTHFLTTRSNTFTVYTTLFDREDPQASTSSQVTLDRSNLLPRLVPTGINSFTTLQSDGPPELIARRDYSYFNAQYDQ